jgi:elongation factor Tu
MAFLDREEKHAPFLMEVEDAFAVKDGVVILSGKMKSGTIAIGDQVEIIGFSPTIKRAMVAAKDILYQGTIQLQGLSRADIFRGQVVTTPGTMKPSTTFWAQVIFSATQARIDPQPFLGTFRTLFHIRGADIYGTLWLPERTALLTPGDQVEGRIELQYPSALEPGLAFGIGRLMGRGTVLRLLG